MNKLLSRKKNSKHL